MIAYSAPLRIAIRTALWNASQSLMPVVRRQELLSALRVVKDSSPNQGKELTIEDGRRWHLDGRAEQDLLAVWAVESRRGETELSVNAMISYYECLDRVPGEVHLLRSESDPQSVEICVGSEPAIAPYLPFIIDVLIAAGSNPPHESLPLLLDSFMRRLPEAKAHCGSLALAVLAVLRSTVAER